MISSSSQVLARLSNLLTSPCASDALERGNGDFTVQMTQGAPSHIIIEHRGHPGLLAGLLGCVFGVLGILTLAFVFVPLAALCSFVGLIRGMDRDGAAGVGTSLIGVCLCVFGFATSPVLLGITGAFLAGNALTRNAPVIQQPIARQQPTTIIQPPTNCLCI